MSAQRIATALVAALAADVLLIVVTGSASLWPGLSPAGARGFLARLALLGLALWVRLRVLAPRERRPAKSWVLLLLLALPALAQLHLAGSRLSGDGYMYYVYVRSLVKDGDIDFTNEYAHYGQLDREDLRVPTVTGLRRSVFSVGSGIMWIPFFLAGEAVARVQAARGLSADLSGYGPTHVNAVALGTFLYGLGAVLLVHATLRRHFRPGVALAAALLLWTATFLHWYMVHQPAMAPPISAFATALFLWLWDRQREGRSPAGFALLGLALGLAMCIRWQNALFGVLPAFDLVRAALRDGVRPRLFGAGAAFGVGVAAGALPQMLAWHALYDVWILTHAPHGTDFVRLGRPFLLETLFSSRHGLLSWTPVLWGGFLGLIPLVRRRPALGLPLLAPILLMTYLNASSGDWWAGGAFSSRRFDGLLPALACGLAASIEVLRAWLRRRPRAAVALAALPFVAWTGTMAALADRGLLPARDTVAFPRLAEGAAGVVAGVAGSPPTWPASWLFAWSHHRPAAQYDLLVGRYLFYRQANLGGRIPLGTPGDEVLLAEGWGERTEKDGVPARALDGRARLFAPLDVPEDLEVWWRFAAADPPVQVVVEVNGQTAGRFLAGAGWSEHRHRIPAAFWRRDLNDVVLQASPGRVLVASIQMVRLSAPPGQERGMRER
jgi:hypothetical protein